MTRRLDLNLTWVLISLVIFFTGCATTSRVDVMEKDLYVVQTRLLKLEQQYQSDTQSVKKDDDFNKKKIASAYSDIDTTKQEINRLKGEIDALRVGVTTGQMPGTETPREGSVASTLTSIMERLETLETTQAELIAAVKKSGIKTSASSSDKNGSKKKVSSLKEVKEAFAKKQYKRLVEELPAFLKKAKDDEHMEALYLFAESFYKLGKLSDAALKYNDLLTKYGEKFKLQAHVKMRLGDCFRHMGDNSTAKIYYEEVVNKYPNSSEAASVKDKLSKM